MTIIMMVVMRVRITMKVIITMPIAMQKGSSNDNSDKKNW